MKKTFRFLLMGIMAVSMVFTSCKDDEEDSKPQPEQPAFSFTLEGVASWEPKGILAAYDSYDVVPLIEAYASKNMILSEMMAYFTEETEASSLPADLVMIGTIAEIGTHTATGNFITSDSGETAAAYITGQTDLGDGFIIPTGWVSETMTATITKLDLIEMKFSASISATMKDLVYLYSDGAMGVPDSKAFTATCKDISFIDLSAMFGK